MGYLKTIITNGISEHRIFKFSRLYKKYIKYLCFTNQLIYIGTGHSIGFGPLNSVCILRINLLKYKFYIINFYFPRLVVVEAGSLYFRLVQGILGW